LGYLITYSQPLFLTARVFAAIFVLSVMGISLFVLAVAAEHLAMPWHFNEKRSNAMRQL
jgi:NitT/TauT family transport system permease protein